MARPLRIEFPDALYQATSRGDRREAIFLDDSDRARFLTLRGKACERFDAAVHGRRVRSCLLRLPQFPHSLWTPKRSPGRSLLTAVESLGLASSTNSATDLAPAPAASLGPGLAICPLCVRGSISGPRRSHFLTHLCSLEADPPRAQ